MPKELTPSRTADKYILRLPDGMRDQISEAAKANNRSMNAEIVARLRNTFEDTAQAEPCLRAESIKKMLLEQEQRLEEKFTKAFSERLKAIKE